MASALVLNRHALFESLAEGKHQFVPRNSVRGGHESIQAQLRQHSNDLRKWTTEEEFLIKHVRTSAISSAQAVAAGSLNKAALEQARAVERSTWLLVWPLRYMGLLSASMIARYSA